MGRSLRNEGFHDLENEEISAADKRAVVKTALETCMALCDGRNIHRFALDLSQAEFFEFVYPVPRAVSNPRYSLDHLGSRQIHDALLAFPDHVVAVISRRNHCAPERRRELKNRMPAKRHDVVPFPAILKK